MSLTSLATLPADTLPGIAQTGSLPLALLVSALASGLRNLGKAAAAGSGARAADLGMPPWLLEKARRQARNWNPDRLTRAVHAVARADAEVPQAETDPRHQPTQQPGAERRI